MKNYFFHFHVCADRIRIWLNESFPKSTHLPYVSPMDAEMLPSRLKWLGWTLRVAHKGHSQVQCGEVHGG
jgi:hypothetical protein